MPPRRSTGLVLALGIAGAGAGAGCGSSAAPAGTSGSTGIRDGVATTAAARQRVAAEQAALHAQVLAALKAGARSKTRYGTLPAALAGRQGGLVKMLVARPGQPARTAEGAPVQIVLPSGSAVATAIGPIVPRSIPGTGAPSAPATFTITFSDRRGGIPLRIGAFGVIDESGELKVPRITVQQGPAAETVTMRMRLPVGDGQLEYAPQGKPLATWDFTLETD